MEPSQSLAEGMGIIVADLAPEDISNLVDSFANQYNLPLLSNGRLRGGYLSCKRFEAPSRESAVRARAGDIFVSDSLLRW
jgi:hypothetical protein